MFCITIRDLLWLTVVVGLTIAWMADRNKAEQDKRLALEERDAAIANERRVAELKAREMAGDLSFPRRGRRAATQLPISN
jgi:hypothetical protein